MKLTFQWRRYLRVLIKLKFSTKAVHNAGVLPLLPFLWKKEKKTYVLSIAGLIITIIKKHKEIKIKHNSPTPHLLKAEYNT